MCWREGWKLRLGPHGSGRVPVPQSDQHTTLRAPPCRHCRQRPGAGASLHMKMAVSGEKYTSISPAGTKNFGGGRGISVQVSGLTASSVTSKGKCQRQWTTLEILMGNAPNASEPDLHFWRGVSVQTALTPCCYHTNPDLPTGPLRPCWLSEGRKGSLGDSWLLVWSSVVKSLSNLQAFNTLILKTEIVFYFVLMHTLININVKGTSKFVLSTANAFKVNSAY